MHRQIITPGGKTGRHCRVFTQAQQTSDYPPFRPIDNAYIKGIATKVLAF